MQVTSSHSLMFVKPTVGEKSSSTIPVFFDAPTFNLKPTDIPVEIPDWVTSDPHFKAARASGWIVVDGDSGIAEEDEITPLAHHSDESLFEEFHRRISTFGRDFEKKAEHFFASKQNAEVDEEDEDDPMQKSSGVDGDAGDWTLTEGAGLTDNTTPTAEAKATGGKSAKRA